MTSVGISLCFQQHHPTQNPSRCRDSEHVLLIGPKTLLWRFTDALLHDRAAIFGSAREP